jgi:hypothetical protein
MRQQPTTNPVTDIRENPKQPQQQPTAKDIIAANVKSLIEQLEAGHSAALTAYLDAMSRCHNYSFGNILEMHGSDRPPPGLLACTHGTSSAGR